MPKLSRLLAHPLALVAMLAAGVLVATVVSVGPARAQAGLLGFTQHLAGATPIASQQDIVNARGRPILAAEETHFAQSVSTTTVNILGNSATTGPAEATYAEDVVQLFRITNSHATQAVCLDIVTKASATQTCNTLCTGLGAGVQTCGAGGGVQTDGVRLTSSMPPYTVPITGLDCICAEAEAASTTVQATRITRSPNL